MARAASPTLSGKERTLGGGQRPWRSKLNWPTGRYPLYRVSFKEPQDDGTWVWTSRTQATEDAARELFATIEAALDGHHKLPEPAHVQATRTVEALGALYLADSRTRGRAARTVEQRECMLRKHITPRIGETPVTEWRVTHSQKVLEGARASVNTTVGLSDIRTTLSGMRKLAWREGWLSRAVDPLDGLEIAKQQTLHGAGVGYVPQEWRPETTQVDAAAAAADYLVKNGPKPLRRLPAFGTQIRVGNFGGLRLGDQHALRAVDVFLVEGYVMVNGAWVQPRTKDAPPFRGPVKNGRVHDVPLPRTLLDELQPLCAVALGLPSDATQQQVVNAQRRERALRGRAAGSPDRWWEASVAAKDEPWLFVDTATGLPPRSELLNDRWHRVRRWVSENDPENEWPEYVTYRNLRHHAATAFWHDKLGREWQDVALWLGDELTTVLNHYVRSGAGATADMVKVLDAY